jgi:hypothetical protein
MCLESSRPEELQEGCTESQKEAIRAIKGTGHTVNTQWRKLWKILFPHDPDESIPDPCKSATLIGLHMLICY